MADVTGRISTLPGSLHAAPEGQMCDQHPGRPAAGRIQGETDSFGSEMHDLCAECIDEMNRHAREDCWGFCSWCKKESDDLRNMRDYEEGLYGPVYRVCPPCRRRYFEELEQSNDDT